VRARAVASVSSRLQARTAWGRRTFSTLWQRESPMRTRHERGDPGAHVRQCVLHHALSVRIRRDGLKTSRRVRGRSSIRAVLPLARWVTRTNAAGAFPPHQKTSRSASTVRRDRRLTAFRSRLHPGLLRCGLRAAPVQAPRSGEHAWRAARSASSPVSTVSPLLSALASREGLEQRVAQNPCTRTTHHRVFAGSVMALDGRPPRASAHRPIRVML